MNDLQSRIKHILKLNGLNNKEFAEKIGMAQSSVSMLLSGKMNPNPRTIKTICSTFDVREDWLVNGEGDMYEDFTREDAVAEIASEILGDDDPDKLFLIKMLSRMNHAQLEIATKIITSMVDGTLYE